MPDRQHTVDARNSDPLARLIADIYESAGLLRRRGEALAAAEGQTQARFQLLSVISDRALTVPQAARRLGQTRQGVQRVANDLVDGGLARLTPNPDHKSSLLLTITPPGLDTLRRITKRATTSHRRLGLDVSQREIETARRVLEALIERLSAQSG